MRKRVNITREVFSLLLLMVTALGTWGQAVTSVPTVVQTDSRDIVITFHADQGNKGLQGLTAADKVYAHTGVIMSSSGSDSDWKYAPTWLDNSAKYEMKWVATDTWTLTIPDIASYYGIPESQVDEVNRLAFVFRNANGSREGKTATGGDFFINVEATGFVLSFTSGMTGNSVNVGESVLFTARTTQACDIALYLNSGTTPLRQLTNTRTLELARKFTSAGKNTMRAVAKYNGETYEKTIEVNVVGKSPEAPYPAEMVKMGPVTNADGSVTFCIAAPEKTSVMLVGSWNDFTEDASSLMSYQEVDGVKYFWKTVSGLTLGKDYIYYFVVDATRKVCDPYARLVLDPWNDQYIPASVYPNIPAYPSAHIKDVPVAVYNSTHGNSYKWKVTDFKGAPKDELVIYELLIRDFTGTEGSANGEGTIKGALRKLDYIQSLGVNAVELLPIMEFSGNNSWGYNPNFYFAPDKAYGTPDDYRRFIDECHRRGMAVILDIVLNHTDGLHPWYQMYDITANPLINATPPHSYNAFNDWKQEHPLVQQQWHDALAYWLTEFKADGFRFDLVKGYGNSDSYGNTYDAANNSWGTPSESATNRYNATRVARMKALHDAMRTVNPDAYFINENLAGAQEENEMAQDGELNWANINYNACQFAMGYSEDSYLSRFYAPDDDGRILGSTVSYAESHDEERMAYKQAMWGAEGVKDNPVQSMRRLGSVAAQMLMSPGSHMIWQFSEFGADQTTKKADGDNETAPKKVIWSYLDNPENAGLLQSYRELCYLRAYNPQLFRCGEVTATVNLTAWNGRTISLVNGSDELHLVVNPSVTASATIATSSDLSSSRYKLMSASYSTAPAASSKGVTLEPGAYAIYGTSGLIDMSGITAVIDNPATAVTVSGRDIIIEGPHAADARVFTIDGRPTRSHSLMSGIYLVAVPGQPTVKVAVK